MKDSPWLSGFLILYETNVFRPFAPQNRPSAKQNGIMCFFVLFFDCSQTKHKNTQKKGETIMMILSVIITAAAVTAAGFAICSCDDSDKAAMALVEADTRLPE
jgi:hypothetical protein